MRAKATSSSKVPIVARSITIQKRQSVQPRLTGLRSDEILQERAALINRQQVTIRRMPPPERQLFVPRRQAPSIHDRLTRKPIIRRQYYDI